jgi:hypothetical protein
MGLFGGVVCQLLIYSAAFSALKVVSNKITKVTPDIKFRFLPQQFAGQLSKLFSRSE